MPPDTLDLFPPLEPKLRGKVALVTGAARGLGRAYAMRLARLGADVAVNDIDLTAAREFDEELTALSVVDECLRYGVRAIGVEADVTNRSEVDAMVGRIVDELGRLDILVTNAGGMLRPSDGDRATAEHMSEDDFRFLLDVNLLSTVFCCQAAAPVMKAQGSGRIVTVASTAAFGGGGLVSYGVAKAGIVRYSRALARELGPHGVNVNVIAPRNIVTSRVAAQFPWRKEETSVPLGRPGVPEDVAKVIEFLVTDLSDFVTGQVLVICGGGFLYSS